MADSVRMQALRNLSNQLPAANAQLAQGQAAARDMQLQKAVAAAPQKANITQTAQQTGAASAENAGQQMIDRASQQVKQQGQIGALGNQAQQQQSQATTASLQQGSREQQMNAEERFAKLAGQAKQELYDRQMQFEKDEMGRTKFNEVQLADYARLKAQNDEEFRNYSQAAQQANQRSLQAMETAYNKITADLEFRYKQAEQKKDQQSMAEITRMKVDADRRMQEERNRAANNSAMWTTAGTVAGGVAGAVFGGPAGAMVGAQAGGAAGGMVGSQVG